MKVYEGTIITCDEKNTVAKFLVEDEGRILYVGDDLPEEYESEACISLGHHPIPYQMAGLFPDRSWMRCQGTDRCFL